MSEIEYKPHCSKCGELIRGEVAYQEIFTGYGYTLTKPSMDKFTDIYPMRCRRCGEPFDCISITPPRKLQSITLGEGME